MIECVMLDTLPEKANLILNILWDRNHPMSVTELIEALKEEFSLSCEKEEVQDYLRFLLASDYAEKEAQRTEGAVCGTWIGVYLIRVVGTQLGSDLRTE